MPSNIVTLSKMIDAALMSAAARQQEAREKQIQMMRLTQTRKPTSTEIEIYGAALRDYLKSERAQ